MRRLLLAVCITGCTQLLPTTPTGPEPVHHSDGGTPRHDAGVTDAGTVDAGAAEGSPCSVTSDCRSDLSCPTSSHVCERCVAGEVCGDGGVCFAQITGPNAPRTCGYGAHRDPCFDDTDCQPDHTCVIALGNNSSWLWCRCTGPSCPECLDENQFCDGGLCHGDGGALICTPGQNGEHCRDTNDCVDGGACYTATSSSGSSLQCTDGLSGSPCGDDVQCHSGTCSQTVTAAGVVSSCN